MTAKSLSINWQWSTLDALSVAEAVAMFQLRQAVFIVEQDCPFHDIDGLDDQALHLLGWQNNTLIATLRLFPEYTDYQNRCSIGRICTHGDYRRFGAGRELVQQAIHYIEQHYPNRETQIGAQLYLKRFYEGFGFVQSSDVYDEDGIDHIHMIRSAASAQAAQKA